MLNEKFPYLLSVSTRVSSDLVVRLAVRTTVTAEQNTESRFLLEKFQIILNYIILL
jgi:hypothetical protein